jgi:hypothetical protein
MINLLWSVCAAVCADGGLDWSYDLEEFQLYCRSTQHPAI